MKYSKEFKVEALKLSDEIGVRLHSSLAFSITRLRSGEKTGKLH